MTAPDDAAALSVIVVVGERRDRAQRMIDALAGQLNADQIECVIVDVASSGAAALVFPPRLRVAQIRATLDMVPGRARWRGLQAARAPLVAFIEEHCLPEPGWSQAVVAAHKAGWEAVGYAFLNGSPDTYLFRSVFLAEYGAWASPATAGRIDRLPGTNVSYSRDVLAPFGDRLPALLDVDFLLHESLRLRGTRFGSEPAALVSHQSYARVRDLLACHFLLARVQAARRLQVFSWGRGRRLLTALAAPFVLPPLQLSRDWPILRRSPHARSWLYALPVTCLIRACEAWGESLGLLAEAGGSVRAFAWRELNPDRKAR